MPDTRVPDRLSRRATGSAVFRLRTRRASFRDVAVTAEIRVNRWSSARRGQLPAIVLWVRYASERKLYWPSVLRADGKVDISKKVPGGPFPDNAGTYYILPPYTRPRVAGARSVAGTASGSRRATAPTARCDLDVPRRPAHDDERRRGRRPAGAVRSHRRARSQPDAALRGRAGSGSAATTPTSTSAATRSARFRPARARRMDRRPRPAARWLRCGPRCGDVGLADRWLRFGGHASVKWCAAVGWWARRRSAAHG